jgi:quercetin dioxygenase-like cupin family protein
MIAPPPSLTVEVIADGERTGGAYCVLDVRADRGAALPPHAFTGEAALVVVEGTVEVVLAAERRAYAAGEVTCLAAGTARRVSAATACRLLVVALPAGVETLGALLEPPRPGPDDVAALLAAVGVELLPRGWRAGDR